MVEMWISKYALTSGIKKETGRPALTSPEYFVVGSGRVWCKIGTEAHATEQEAIAAADAMRIKKIANLKKQITKLEKLKF